MNIDKKKCSKCLTQLEVLWVGTPEVSMFDTKNRRK